MENNLEKLKKLWGIERLESPFVTSKEMEQFEKYRKLFEEHKKSKK
tara:strand:+ start:62 stop:199 length:138 start_codon:yes stop_codon:yes gene_type:complete